MTQPKVAQQADLEQLYERLKEFDTAMLTTVGRNGHIHSRPMMTQERERDADLWFVTSRRSLKVEELTAHPAVGVIYFRDRDKAYVSLSGTAHLCTDPELARRQWKESWRAWFPEGPESRDLMLIKVDVQEAEYWIPEGGTLRVMFEEARTAISGERPSLAEPERLVMPEAKSPGEVDPEFVDPA